MIHVVGDSHVYFFGGIDKIPNDGINPNFKIYYLGAPLAYNVGRLNTSWKAKEKITDILNKVDDKILFCMGEVDCRYHIKNQSVKQKREISEVVKECVNCYICGINGFNIPRKIAVGVWAPIASTWLTEKEASKDRWILGNCLDRNIITKLFNDYLNQECIKNDIYFFSIFDSLLCQDGTTNMDYYLDTVHLSQKAMLTATEALKEWL